MLDAVVGAAASTQRSVTGSAFIRTCRVAIPGVMLAFLLGCASTSRQPAVPESDTARAQIPGMPGVRYVVPEGIAGFEPDVLQAAAAEQQARSRAGATGPLPPATFLALSGGGDNGAFAAGLLNGWTAAGNRPQFKLVTGISTGALIAPFAFVGGAKHDQALRDFYTGVTSKDVLEARSILAAVTDDAMADNAPLRRLVGRVMTAELMQEIAAEHAKGRVLLIGTTNLDARRGVIWNLTKIAASGHPNSLQLIQDLMVASAAIPGGFPPMMIDVEVDGRRHQEMHVDGGTSAQVFVYPTSLDVQALAAEAGIVRDRSLYIIRSSKLTPGWSEVERRTLSIAGRAVASLITTQGIGDLYRIYAIAQRDRVDFNLAYIPASFDAPHPQEFDTDYMRALFKVGYDLASQGQPWVKRPPGM
jgi:predicted acylesterase/phospholipase RssA